MNTVEAVAEVLLREGTEYLCCFPTTPLIVASARVGIRPVITRVERTLVNMADGYTRVNRGLRNGVCATQYGPGIENAFAGVAQAYADGTPVLLLPLGVESRLLDVPPAFSGPLNYRGITKWADTVLAPERVPHMLRRAFQLLRPASHLIVVSRGGIVDEAALLDALRAGRLAGAGLDVAETEPLPPESPLWDAPNLVLTPHCSGSSPQTHERLWALLAENVRRFGAGEPLLNRCDKRAGY